MALRSSILALVAAAGLVSAQSSTICGNSTVTIQSDGDVATIATCGQLSGNLVFGQGVTTISLPALESVAGDLRVENAVGLTSFSALRLTTIGKVFKLTNLTLLSSLSLPELEEVGSIDWQTLPRLPQLTFTQGVTKADSVKISDTTLQSLDGITLKTVTTIDINNNFQLQKINMQTETIKQSMNIAFNSKNIDIMFPNLIWAVNFTCSDCGDVTVPSLEIINGSMGFVNNSFTSFSAPNLTSVGQSLSFVSNSAATNISLPLLTKIGGGFVIANNTALKVVDGFPDLQTVGGAIDFTGTFTNLTLPSLKEVDGGFNLQTTEDFDCGPFDSLHSKNNIRGNTYVCKPKTTAPTSSNGVTTAGGGSGSSTKKNAAHSLEVATAPVLGLLTFVAFLAL